MMLPLMHFVFVAEQIDKVELALVQHSCLARGP